MKDETFFFIVLSIWYISTYGIPPNLLNLLTKFYRNCDNFINFYNYVIHPDYFNDEEEFNNKEESENNIDDDNDEAIQQKPQLKYEDKYLEDIRKLDKEFIFNKEEEDIKLSKYTDFLKELNDKYSEKVETLKKELSDIQEKLLKYEGCDDYCVYNHNDENDEHINEEDNDEELGKTIEQRIQKLNEIKLKLVEEFSALQKQTETVDGESEIIKQAIEYANEFMVNLRLDKLKNCYVMENTPLGNVLMIYDSSRGTFKYYSDNTIPYRYLEPVARKYVKCFNCRPIFVDMEEELKLAEEKWEKERIEKEQKEEDEKKRNEQLKANNKTIENKKNVFAKFKSYNKDSAAGKSMVAPPKNSIPNKQLTQEQENAKIILKDNANRYTYEGKISNFNFLKKVERKVVDKKYGMTFADFKKIQKCKNIIF